MKYPESMTLKSLRDNFAELSTTVERIKQHYSSRDMSEDPWVLRLAAKLLFAVSAFIAFLFQQKRLLLGLAAFVFFSYYIAGFVVEKVSRGLIPFVVAELDARGIELGGLEFESAELEFPLSLSWTEFSGHVTLRNKQIINKNGAFDVLVRQLRLRPVNFFSLSDFLIEVDGALLLQTASSGVLSDELMVSSKLKEASLSVVSFSKVFELDGFRVKASIANFLEDLNQVMRTGSSRKPFEMEAEASFFVAESLQRVGMTAVADEPGSRLLMSRDDIKRLADKFGINLAAQEIDIVAKYPLQTPKLLHCKNYAERISREKAEKDPSLPEDAYKHVLWSFLLTRNVGAELAREVTDAHERGSRTNSLEEHLMDFNNNELGRRYALEGRNESELLGLVKRDTEIVRSAE